MTELPCPTCGSELAFFEQYNRFYCHRCLRYAPEGYGAKGARKCPNCGGVLSYVAQYDRFYCYRCNTYPPVEVEVPKAAEPTPTPEPVPAAQPVATAPIVAAPESAPSSPTPATLAVSAPVVAPETLPQPKPAEVLPAETAPAAAATPVVVEAKPEAVVEEPRPARPDVKPAVLRLKIFTMRKSELTDLCRAYELDATGTKEELQERLLTFLKKLQAEQEGEAPTPAAEAEPTAASEPAEEEIEAEPTKAPAVLASPEPFREQPEPASAVAPVVLVQEAPQAARAVETAPVVVSPVVVAAHVEHPCPTCGRELSFISQYGRWYCYSCQRYAPATRNACPTCGATMRFIDQYERWWCDSCRRYAPADLPKPRTAAAAAVAQTVVTAPVAARAIVLHRHGSPGSGIALLAFGLMLYVAYAALTLIPDVLSYPRPPLLGNADLALLNFLAFLLMALGAVVGLYSLRHRE